MKERPRGGRAGAAYGRIARLLAKSLDAAVDDLFAPAEETDLDALEQLGMPESVRKFYAGFAPVEAIEVRGVRLWDIPHLLEENHTYRPGADVHDLGYIVVGGNRRGDVYCIDLGEWRDEDPPRVVLLPHDVEIGAGDRGVVDRQAVAAADSFEELLLLLARGEISG